MCTNTAMQTRSYALGFSGVINVFVYIKKLEVIQREMVGQV
jgi:hypothetical protein